jgi:vitamin B12 transporter
MHLYLRPLSAALALLSPLAALAEQPLKPLPTIVVTATRTANTTDETLAPVTVITREEIERKQSQSVMDVLRGTPGLSISNNGGPGKNTSVFLRGAESDHVLVLINGVKVGSATSGTTAFQDIPAEQIERIEIVRGPRSGLYGSEAIGGVIQIFTREGHGPIKPSLSIGGGHYGTSSASAGLSGGTEHGWFSASLSGLATDGFNACDGEALPNDAGCRTNEPDKDGYRNISGSIRAGVRFESGAAADIHWLRTKGDSEFDGTGQNESESVQQLLGGNIRFSPTAIWKMTLSGGRSEDKANNYKNGTFATRFDTERDTGSLQNDISLSADQLLTVGFDYQNDKVNSTTAYAVTSRDNDGLFAQYQGSLGAHNMQLALRRDDNEQFGDHNTGSATWGYRFGNGLRLTASYGSAFKAPTFNELYFPRFGNANLGPEKSDSTELGLSGELTDGSWSVNAYQTKVDDLIAFNAAISAPSNIDQARIRGLEAVISKRAGDWDFAANLTLLDPENRSSGADRGKALPRRAKESFHVDVDREVGKYRFGATLFAEGKRYDALSNIRALGGYTTFDLRAEYIITKEWRIQTQIANLFDKEYETASFYNQPGRNFFVTLRYAP